jgi:acetylglutamate kinase
MRPKVAAARAALEGGVRAVHLVSGIVPDALLAEVFTNEGSGTLLSLSDEGAA